MNRRFANILAVAVSGAVLAVAGYSIADVPNDQYIISDKKDASAEGYLDVSGSSYYAEAYVQCADFTGGTNGSSVLINSYHPDSVKLKKNKGAVEQAEKDNQAIVRLRTGSDPQYTTYLSCDKAEVKADVNDKKTPFKGSFSGSAKKCTCDEGDCGQFSSQVGILATDCDDNKSISGKFKDGALEKIKIKGKGEADYD
jgi:hypothetical protein